MSAESDTNTTAVSLAHWWGLLPDPTVLHAAAVHPTTVVTVKAREYVCAFILLRFWEETFVIHIHTMECT